MPIPDDELIAHIRGGATHLYARIVDRYKDRAMTLAARMLRNREDAEEATQDAFVRAYNALETFKGNAKFSTWLYRIVYNVCLSRLGRRKSEFVTVDYDEGKDYDGIISSSSEPDAAAFERKDLIAFVHRCIDVLPEKYSTMLSLFYVQELSHEEIVDVTQLPLGTVKVRLFRARGLLQESLRKEFQLKKAV